MTAPGTREEPAGARQADDAQRKLVDAVVSGNAELADVLLATGKARACAPLEEGGLLPLEAACLLWQPGAARVLIRHGADPLMRPQLHGATTLISTAVTGTPLNKGRERDFETLLTLLTDAGNDPRQPDKWDGFIVRQRSAAAVSNGAAPWRRTSPRRPLISAIEANAPCAVVGALLRAGADDLESARQGVEALSLAVFLHREAFVLMILDPLVNPAAGRTPIRDALFWLSIPAVNRTVRPEPPSDEHGCRRMLDLLLGLGADPNVTDPLYGTPLSLAVSEGRGDLAQALIDAGADPDGRVPSGWNAARHAVFTGNAEHLRMLLSRGADPGVIVDGASLYELACARRNERDADRQPGDIIEIIKQSGADPNRAGSLGSPLALAVQNGPASRVAQVLRHGAHPDSRDKDGVPALLVAAGDHNAQVMRMLLDAGADPRATSPAGVTAWHRLAGEAVFRRPGSGLHPAAAVLASSNADINAGDAFGRTALAQAAYTGRTETVSVLLAYGADPAVTDQDGTDAIGWARRGAAETLGHDGAVIALLQAHVARRAMAGASSQL